MSGPIDVFNSGALEVAPSMMVGNRWIWNRSDEIPDHLLPLNGQVVVNAETLYPDLWSVRAVTTLIDSFDDGAGSITLENYNGQGRFFRAGTTAGVEQTDTTAANGLRIRTSSGAGGNAFNTTTSMFTNTGNATAQGSVIPLGDPETRPVNVSEIVCIIAKPWVVAGDVTINQGGPIDDQSASGYIDIGDVREQWGTRQINSLGTIVYPQPFRAGTVPVITGTNIDAGGLIRSLVANGNPGVTSASMFSVESDGSTATGTFMWRAIGLKP